MLEKSILINASTEAIDAVVLNGHRLPEWYAGIETATPDSTFPEPGGKVDVNYKSAGMSFKMTMTSTELTPGQSQTLEMAGMITGTNRWTYTPEGSGTRVKATFNYEMPGGGLGKAIDKLVVERMNAKNLEESLKNLKNVVENS